MSEIWCNMEGEMGGGYRWNKIDQGLVTTETGWRLHGDSSH